MARGRKRTWTAVEVAAIQRDLLSMSTSSIAACYGVKVKALRSMLRRNKVSIRFVRDAAKRPRRTCGGVIVRRPVLGAAATYGAAALAELPDHACRWPYGEPSDPDFGYCGAARHGHSSYCAFHTVKAREPVIPAELIAPARRVLSAFKFVASQNGKKAALQPGAHIDGRAARASS